MGLFRVIATHTSHDVLTRDLQHWSQGLLLGDHVPELAKVAKSQTTWLHDMRVNPRGAAAHLASISGVFGGG